MANGKRITDESGETGGTEKRSPSAPSVLGRKLFRQKHPGSPGKLGKDVSTKAESLSKLRGKGAL